ncbi:PREDICTED: interferon-induced protein with tetratricopeptide repeats 2-like [Condylura cristata]|uniref:interferon-induced protein with tetratricopeptide repeats 2-like n=1 Tax=Condylura cristata TaxID=143302 RepID=UPI0006436B60|nr:PREDICTED: interferon-induced protein with tetratricopeptide repeats 2-like [Condylura cristata]
MSESNNSSLEKDLSQLKCHFTWNLLLDENRISDDLENAVHEQIKNLKTEFKATMCNLLAYIKSCRGQNEGALECLQQAEAFTQEAHDAHQAELRSLVTLGNYAWVYYHMGRLSEAQTYVDKVKQVCEKFSSPDSIECPELYNEEGWALLKCGEQNERAMVCFQKALERKPDNPEFTTGLAIAVYRLDESLPRENLIDLLKKAIQLDSKNQYVKVLLALKLQRMNKGDEGERLVEEALEKAPHATDVIVPAAKFYRSKGDLDKAISLLKQASTSMPENFLLYFYIGSCYRQKILKITQENKNMSPNEKQKLVELIEEGLYHLKRCDKLKQNYSNTRTFTESLENIRRELEKS